MDAAKRFDQLELLMVEFIKESAETRQEIRATNQRLDQTNQRFDQLLKIMGDGFEKVFQVLDETNRKLDKYAESLHYTIEAERRNATKNEELEGRVKTLESIVLNRAS